MGKYNLDAIKAALTKQTTKSSNSTNNQKFQKSTYWKPAIGSHDIRFLPYLDSTGQPFQEVLYYEKISDKRIVAPFLFGMQDPIKDLFETKRKEKDGWDIAKHLKPKERFYAVLIDRNDEAKGPQIWEFSKDIRDDIYAKLTSKDYVDEDLFDPVAGYDFEVGITQATDNAGKLKTFNGYPVKKYTLNVRRKPSKLHKDEKVVKQWLDSIPNLEDMFKRQVKEPEELLEALDNFVAKLTQSGENNDSPSGEESTGLLVDLNDSAEKKLSDAFSGF